MMITKYKISSLSNLFALILMLIGFCIILPSTSFAANSYTVNNGATNTIDEHGVCKKITNNHASGKSIMVPTKASIEWSDFRSHLPAGVTQAVCPPVCGGTMHAGYCWYLGSNNQSCDTTCAGHGGNSSGTVNYVGTGAGAPGQANCYIVADLLIANTTYLSGTPAPAGCLRSAWGPTVYYSQTTPTTTSATQNGYGRICSCNS